MSTLHIANRLGFFQQLLEIFGEESNVPKFVEQTVQCLKTLRNCLADGSQKSSPELVRIDFVLVQLLSFQRSLMDPLDNMFESWEVPTTDIHEDDWPGIEDFVGCARLSDATDEGGFPVTGRFWGPHNRMLVPLTVSTRRKCINVVFLYDTGAPYTFLRQDTLDALGFEHVSSSNPVRIQGRQVSVGVSHGHFENVDVLGQNALAILGASVITNYRTQSFEILL
eukprot:GILI01030910.1.p1 GENE.GILI01030910.1~~GILI01030910.1.p1  ORF type:complete len:234 (-),score=22.12 GILI01030910.1:71-742(-)